MKKDVLIMLGGSFVALLPFLGFRNSWDTVLLVIAGVCLIGLGIAVRRGDRSPMQLPPRSNPNDFGESGEMRHES